MNWDAMALVLAIAAAWCLMAIGFEHFGRWMAWRQERQALAERAHRQESPTLTVKRKPPYDWAKESDANHVR